MSQSGSSWQELRFRQRAYNTSFYSSRDCCFPSGNSDESSRTRLSSWLNEQRPRSPQSWVAPRQRATTRQDGATPGAPFTMKERLAHALKDSGSVVPRRTCEAKNMTRTHRRITSSEQLENRAVERPGARGGACRGGARSEHAPARRSGIDRGTTGYPLLPAPGRMVGKELARRECAPRLLPAL